jgi:hypothetical protein
VSTVYTASYAGQQQAAAPAAGTATATPIFLQPQQQGASAPGKQAVDTFQPAQQQQQQQVAGSGYQPAPQQQQALAAGERGF